MSMLDHFDRGRPAGGARWPPAPTAGSCTTSAAPTRSPGACSGSGGMGSRGGSSSGCRLRASRSRSHTRSSLARWRASPGRILPYARWQELHEAPPERRGREDGGDGDLARDAVPYLDRVPFGVVELHPLARRHGGSRAAALVTQFASRWNAEETAGHDRAPRNRWPRSPTTPWPGPSPRAVPGSPRRRCRPGWSTRSMRRGWSSIIRRSSASARTQPTRTTNRSRGRTGPWAATRWCCSISGVGRRWGRCSPTRPGWGSAGPTPPARVQLVWETVRDARDAAIALVEDAVGAGGRLRGFEIDRAARDVIEAAGFGQYFVHRTGHSIDRDLHGSGPHNDDYETHDDRLLMPGVGFSIEPGIYLPGEFGVRSEVNMYWGPERGGGDAARRQRVLVVSAWVASASERSLRLHDPGLTTHVAEQDQLQRRAQLPEGERPVHPHRDEQQGEVEQGVLVHPPRRGGEAASPGAAGGSTRGAGRPSSTAAIR